MAKSSWENIDYSVESTAELFINFLLHPEISAEGQKLYNEIWQRFLDTNPK